MSFAVVRSPSRRPTSRFGGSGQDLTRSYGRLPYRAGNNKSPVSVSMDNLLFNQDSLPDWFPGTSSFRRTEELQCVFIPDDQLLQELLTRQAGKTSQACGCPKQNVAGKSTKTSVRRSESFHVSRKVEINKVRETNRPKSAVLSKPQPLMITDSKTTNALANLNGVQVKRSASMYARMGTQPCCLHATTTRALSSPRDHVSSAKTTNGSATSNDVQLRRCLSLYERAKVQGNRAEHDCNSQKDIPCSPRYGVSKVSPTNKRSPTEKTSKSGRPRTSSASSNYGSVGSDSRPSSRLSMHSSHNSSDLDRRSPTRSLTSSGSKRSPNARGRGSTLRERTKQSSIPRPVKICDRSPTTPRARSNSLEGHGRLNGHPKNKVLTNSFVTRSVPSTPNVLEPRGSFFNSGKDFDSDFSSTETLNGTCSPVDDGVGLWSYKTYLYQWFYESHLFLYFNHLFWVAHKG